MSNRLYGSLLQSAGRRYYFALDSVPSVLTPAPAVLTLFGREPSAAQNLTVFRSPAAALLTLSGLSLSSPTVLSPATGALATVGQIPGKVTELTISPALPAPVYSALPDNAPTLITIWTTQPGCALLTLQTLEQNVTQGGNIGFVSPAPASLQLQTRQFSLLLLVGGAQPGLLTVEGRQPTLQYELTIQPQVGQVTMVGGTPFLGLPFIWIDDDPAPASTWITDAAA